jgi:hypothetical protein
MKRAKCEPLRECHLEQNEISGEVRFVVITKGKLQYLKREGKPQRQTCYEKD